MEKFPSESYRDSLAKKLKNHATGADLEVPNKIDIHELEIGSVEYRMSSIIKRLRQALPEETVDYKTNFMPDYESVEHDDNWDTLDISKEMDEIMRLHVELDYLIKVFWKLKFDRKLTEDQERKIDEIREEAGSVSELNKEEMLMFMNRVSGGLFLDNKNLNHVVGATGIYSHDRFSVSSPIDQGKSALFYLEPGRNTWVLASLSQPLMMMTPCSQSSRYFMENALGASQDKEVLIQRAKERLSSGTHERIASKFKEGSFDGYYVEMSNHFKISGSPIYNLLYLANLPIHDPVPNDGLSWGYIPKNLETQYSWKDVFDTIVDLRAEKVFKRKIPQDQKVQEQIEYYRKLLKEEFELPEVGN